MKVSSRSGRFCAGAIAAAALTLQAQAQAQEGGKLMRLPAEGTAWMAYQSAPSPFKPYVKELTTAAGAQLLLDGSESHPHHHGLMFAHYIDNVNFWAEVSGPMRHPERKPFLIGSIVPRGEPVTTPTSILQTLDWTGPDGVSYLVEERTLSVSEKHAGNARVLTWRTRQRLADGRERAVLGGPKYVGLGMRFVPDFNRATEFLFSASEPGPADARGRRLTPGDWAAARGTVGGKPVTVAMFSRPDNSRAPTTWFTMADPFAYLSAALRLDQEPIELMPGQELQYCWGVALWDGMIEAPAISALYREWIEATEGTTH